MNNEFVKYNASLKKQIAYGLIWLGLICIVGYFLYPVNTSDKYIVFMPFAIVISIITIWLINKSTKDVVCPQCNNNLYEVIERRKKNKQNINCCPFCGYEIQV